MNEKTLSNRLKDSKALRYFLSLSEHITTDIGINTRAWSTYVYSSDAQYPALFNKRMRRAELLDFCQDPNNSDLYCLLAILAWGGMNRQHGRMLLQQPAAILESVRKLRNNEFLSRSQAYAYLHKLRQQNHLPGMGVAYYTKIIAFLAPTLHAYMMDQWLAKSINLIYEQEIVLISKGSWVHDNNTAAQYEAFCTALEHIAEHIQQPPFLTEEMLFSIGGRNKGPWRQYLIDHYK